MLTRKDSESCTVPMKKPLFVPCPVALAPFLCCESIETKMFSLLNNFWSAWLQSRASSLQSLIEILVKTVLLVATYGTHPSTYPVPYIYPPLNTESGVSHGAGSGDTTMYFSGSSIFPEEEGCVLCAHRPLHSQ